MQEEQKTAKFTIKAGQVKEQKIFFLYHVYNIQVLK